MEKREKLQYAMVFAVDLLALMISTSAAWLVLDRGLGVILKYSGEDIFQFVLILLLAFLLVFLIAESAQNITRRSVRAELWDCLRVDSLLARCAGGLFADHQGSAAGITVFICGASERQPGRPFCHALRTEAVSEPDFL